MNDATIAEEEDAANHLDPLIEDTENSLIRALTRDSISSPPDAAASTGDIFGALRSPEQRFVLTYLLRASEEIRLSSLLDYVLANTDGSNDEAGFRNRVAVTLTNTHLPSLVDKGFIEYNIERQLIRAGPNIAQVAPYLKLALAQQRRLDERNSE